MTLSIFSCVCWPSVCLLGRTVYLDLLPIFWLGCLFFWYWAGWVVCIVWRLISWICFIYKYFLSFWGLSFCLVYGFLCCIKVFKFQQVLLVYFWLYFHFSRRWIQKDSAVIYVSVLPMFSSKSFRVSSLTFRSLIHFEFIFVCGVKECYNFIFYM